MKRLFLVFVLMFGLAACVEESLDETTRDTIGFEPMVGKNTITKATELNDDNFSEFRVWAYYTDDDNFGTLNANPSTYIPGIEVTKSGSHWNYSPAYYWPLTGNLSFFGIGGDGVDNYTQSGSSFPSFSYTIADTSSEQKDLVVAVITNQNKQANGGNAVNMVFNHILTQVNFSLKGKNTNLSYKVKEIRLEGAKKSGTFTFNGTTGTWETSNDTVDYIYFSHEQGKPINRNVEDFISFGDGNLIQGSENTINNRALMLMPQDFVGRIKVKYDVINPAEQPVHTDKWAETNLTTTWGLGSKIRYNLTLPAGGSIIEFDVVSDGVDNWQ